MDTIALIFWIEVGLAILGFIVFAMFSKHLKDHHPETLKEIDPHGYRTMNLSSQIRINAYVLTRRFVECDDAKTRLLGNAYMLITCTFAILFVAFIVLL